MQKKENYRVFTDFHHAGLLRSLIMLFEDRLNGELYRPIGLEWYEKGYWKLYEDIHPATVQQYLGIGGATPDDSRPLNEVVEMTASTDKTVPITYHCQDIDSGYTNKAIEFDEFMRTPFDIVIASVPNHIEKFKKLCEIHSSKPKLIFQIGNAWTVEAGLAPNIMASAIIDDVPEDINFISYHQEFPLDIFERGLPNQSKIISSFVNVFQKFPDYKLFLDVEETMSDWTFNVYGGQGRNDPLHGDRAVAQAMRDAQFIWHTKAGGDGYGHVVHNIGAVGRPMIVKKEYYKGKMAEALMIDEVTCIAIDNLGYNEIVNKIVHFSEENRYKTMCDNAYNNFKKVVDFDKEEKQIRDFLARLQ